MAMTHMDIEPVLSYGDGQFLEQSCQRLLVYQENIFVFDEFSRELASRHSTRFPVQVEFKDSYLIDALLELSLADLIPYFPYRPSGSSKKHFVISELWNDLLFGWCDGRYCYAVNWYAC